MTNTTSLSQVVKDLYTANPHYTVKDILAVIHDTNHPTASLVKDKAHYRAVYNTLKRVSKGSKKAPKAVKTEKASIIFDLTQTPSETVPGKVYFKGQA